MVIEGNKQTWLLWKMVMRGKFLTDEKHGGETFIFLVAGWDNGGGGGVGLALEAMPPRDHKIWQNIYS